MVIPSNHGAHWQGTTLVQVQTWFMRMFYAHENNHGTAARVKFSDVLMLWGFHHLPVAPTVQGRKATNVSLGSTLLVEAKALGINISQAAEAGLARAVAERRAELWLQANQEALESSNAYVEANGCPGQPSELFDVAILRLSQP